MANGEYSLGYLGPKGTFSERAALKFTESNNEDYSLNPFPTIPHVLQAIVKGEIDLGIVPVENSIEGTVNITLDLLVHDFQLYIQGELVLDIEHCLISNCNNAKKIHTIYSHPQALAQCRKFLSLHFSHAQYLTANSTAEAACLVKNGEKGLAAISSVEAAKEYDLEVLFSDTSDYQENQTRFLIIGTHNKPDKTATKTSLCVALPKDKPGGLYNILGVFAEDKINLTKIESRPAKKELGNYIFFIDCMADLLIDKPHILDKLKGMCNLVKVLGAYTQVGERG